MAQADPHCQALVGLGPPVLARAVEHALCPCRGLSLGEEPAQVALQHCTSLPEGETGSYLLQGAGQTSST